MSFLKFILIKIEGLEQVLDLLLMRGERISSTTKLYYMKSSYSTYYKEEM